MFDIGFAELVLLMLVGLLVLGPEKLPRVARDAGLYLRKARRAWNQMRHSIEQELDASEMRRALEETQESAQTAVDELKQSINPESSISSTSETDKEDG
jgi:sec-independent protein translocase protein TatB